MDSLAPPNWIELKDQLNQKYYIHANSAIKKFLWVIVAIFPVAVILHIVGAIKRGRHTGFWLVRRDPEGYIVQNRHVLIHTLSAIKTILACIAIILIQHDIRSHIHHYWVAVQATGFVIMHFINWHRTWASIYSMPPTSLYLNLNQSVRRSGSHQTDRICPPWLFNLGLIGGSVYGVVLTAATTTIICDSTKRANFLYASASAMLDENIALMQNPIPRSEKLMMENASAILKRTDEMLQESHRVLLAFQYLVCGFVAINTISVTLFWWSLNAIVRCLNRQLRTYQRCLQNRDEAIQLGMVSVGQEPADDNPIQSDNSPRIIPKESFRDIRSWSCAASQAGSWISGAHYNRWKSWFPSLRSDNVAADHLIWRSTLMRPIKREGASFKSQLCEDYARLRRCKTNTLWQALFITLMSWAYTSMAIVLGANAFDVPDRTSVPQLGLYVIVWSNTIWVVGGTALAALSARVAFLGGSIAATGKTASDEECQAKKSFDY